MPWSDVGRSTGGSDLLSASPDAFRFDGDNEVDGSDDVRAEEAASLRLLAAQRAAEIERLKGERLDMRQEGK